MQDHCDLQIAGADHQIDVADDRLAELFLWVLNRLDLFEHALIENIHAVVHDLKQEPVLAAHMMIEPRFGELDGLRDVLHRGAIVPFFVEDAGGNAADFTELLFGIRVFSHRGNTTQQLCRQSTTLRESCGKAG